MIKRRRLDASDGLRIAVDATCWLNNRGYGRHARDLLGALVRIDTQNRYCFFVDSQEMLKSIPDGVESVLVPVGTSTALAASADGNRSLQDIWRMSRALSRSDFDLVLFPSVYSYVPVLSRAHQIVFIHDVIAEKFPELTVPSLPRRLLWQSKVRLALYQAGTIVTVSEYSKQGIVEVFKVNPNQVHVVGEAPNPVFKRLEKPKLPTVLNKEFPEASRSVVYIGGFGPHKNLSRLVETFAKIAAFPEFSDVYLILVGEYQKEVFHTTFAELRQQIEMLGIQRRVIFTGYLPDPDVVNLLNQASVLVLPSLMEGLGLPAIEAAACGCPVVATKSSPLPELLGEGGVYLKLLESKELEDALRLVLGSEEIRKKMRAAGLKATQMLTWEGAAGDLRYLVEKADAG